MAQLPEPRKYTTAEIAKLANVSPATVSKVLNGATDVGAKTRAKVLQIMDEVNFVPHRSAKTYKYIAADMQKVHGHFAANLLASIVKTSLSHGVLVTIAPSDFLQDVPGGLKQFMRRSGILGFLLRPRTPDDPLLHEVLAQNIPHVLINRQFDMPGVNYVAADIRQGAYDAAHHLLQLNHRRIAFIGNPVLTSVSFSGYLEGYKSALRDHGITPDPRLILNHLGDRTPESGRQAVLELWSRDEKPTALMVVNEGLALGCVKALQHLRVRVPDQLSIITLDELPGSSLLQPESTYLRLPIEALGQEATRFLLGHVGSGTCVEPLRKILPAPLVVRESTGPAPGAPAFLRDGAGGDAVS